jgi:ankyrin repeat protein
MNPNSVLSPHRSVRTFGSFLFLLFSWSSLALCGEIHEAVKRGDVKKVKSLLQENPALVNLEDERGATPLFLAVSSDQPSKEIVEALLEKGATGAYKTSRGYTRDFGNHEIETILENYSEVRRIESLVKEHPDLLNASVEKGRAEMHRLAARGRKAAIEVLLKNKADVNVRTWGEDETPLHYAVGNGHLDIVALLLANGADVNAAQRANKWTPLIQAVNAHQMEIAEFLISHGADVNRRDFMNRTALHWAITSGPLDTVRSRMINLLISKGADIKGSGKDWSPLHAAAGTDAESTKLLLDRGAEVNARDGAGHTPLYEAAGHGDKAIVELLLERGADVNAKDIGGDTALHRAAQYGNVSVAQVLIAHGIDINARTLYGKTARQYAREATVEGKNEFIDFLLQHGAKE